MQNKLKSAQSSTPVVDIARCYVRVSDVRGRAKPGAIDDMAETTRGIGGGEFLSPEIQIESARSVAKIFGYQFDEESSLRLADLGQSGFRKNWRKRPGITGLLAAAERGEFNRLIVYKMSRLTRNLLDGLEIFNAFEAAGCSIYVVKEQFDSTTAVGRLVRNILLSVAEMMAEGVREDAAAMHARRAAAGKAPAHTPSWIRKKEDGTYEIDEDRAPVYRRMIELRTQSRGFVPIARALNNEGLLTPRNLPWTAKGIQTLLKGYRLKRFGGYATYELMDGSVVEIPGAYPALADEATMERLNAVLDTLRRGRGTNNNNVRGASTTTKYLLSSRIHCAVCGSMMFGGSVGRSMSRAYTCDRGRTEVGRHPDKKSVILMADALEEAVFRVVRYALLQMPPAKKSPQQRKQSARRAVKTEEAVAIRAQMSDLVSMRLAKEITPEIYRKHFADLELKLAAVESESTVEPPDNDALYAAAQGALQEGDLRWLILNTVDRVDTPVYLEGVHTVTTPWSLRVEKGGIPAQRRCVQVKLRWPTEQGDTIIAPIYRCNYTGIRQLFTPDGREIYSSRDRLDLSKSKQV